MAWDVDFHSQFVPEFEALDQEVQDELYAHIEVLNSSGPGWDGRPWTRWRVRVTRT
jgi:hypothetical protein